MDVFWGSSILVEPSYINRLIITTTTTLLASQLNFSNGTVFQYLIAGGGTSTSGGKVHLGSAVVVDLVCTVGAYNGISTIPGLGLSTISSEETWIPRGSGVYPGIYGIGSGSTSGVIDGANTGKQGNSANTGIIILFY